MAKLSLSIALAAIVVAAPIIASAQPIGSYNSNYSGYNTDTDCQQRVNNNKTTGGLVGAGVGAIAGSNIAGGNNRKEGAILGAVVGAVIGASVAKDRVACDDRYEYERNRYNNERPYSNYPYSDRSYSDRDYRHDDNRNNGYRPSVYDRGYEFYGSRDIRYSPPSQYGRGNRCGWGTAAYRLPNGRVTHDQVYMCQQRDGDWVISQR